MALPDQTTRRSLRTLRRELAEFDRVHEETEERWERGDQVLYDAVERAILHVREQKPSFLDPEMILTGVQIIDAIGTALEDMLRISARVNSPAWHAKLVRATEISH